MQLALALLFILTAVGASAAFGYTVFHPVAVAANGTPLRNTFRLGDALSLTILLTIPLMFYSTVRRDFRDAHLSGDILALALVGAFIYVWWRGTVTLTRLGISDGFRRFIYLCVVIPISILGSAFLAPAVALTALDISHSEYSSRVLWGTGLFVSIATAVCCRLTNLWILAGQTTLPEHELSKSHAR